MTESIKNAIIKYITRSATASDISLLSEWIRVPSNKKEFENFIKDYYTITYSVNNPDTDRAVDKLLDSIKKREALGYRKKRLQKIYYAAAVFTIAILTASFIYKDHFFAPNKSISSAQEIKAGTDKAILTLADGSEVQLGQKEVVKADNYESNGIKLEYRKDDKASENAIAYHLLTVPRGGRFMIELSDGTKVWLNSDSRLKYPTKFKKGDSRKVELVYGEAYFDVSPAKEHHGADFRVYNNGQEVKVLGTEFNIKAYKDENDIYTTLVEGKVALKCQDKSETLVPGEQAVYDIKKNAITTKTIDVYNETSWRQGIFSFDNKPLREIMKVLSRWYDVNFEFVDDKTPDEEFIGVLSKNQDIEAILLQIKNSGIINDYEIEENKVIIK
ncbi:FecR family protein [Zhouia sp. PK063]|uniref:FecR family protein n=1 Tax=Zhouia sp. PK063 TaxID=3373602 RepID=UPI003795428A